MATVYEQLKRLTVPNNKRKPQPPATFSHTSHFAKPLRPPHQLVRPKPESHGFIEEADRRMIELLKSLGMWRVPGTQQQEVNAPREEEEPEIVQSVHKQKVIQPKKSFPVEKKTKLNKQIIGTRMAGGRQSWKH